MATSPVDHLNSLLRGEIAAVESYRQALARVHLATTKCEIAECERSHELRVIKLKDRIRQLGGTPVHSSGAWGAFVKVVQSGADVFGDKLAVAALEEGEDLGVNDYKKALLDVDEESRDLVEKELLPAQMRTHRAMSSLKRALQ
jgi:hypothetical protein